MIDKIKLKADKFVNDKKLKLNYIKPKDLKILLAEFCEEQIAELKAECDLAIEGRDVKIKELEAQSSWSKQNYLNAECYEQSMKKRIIELEQQIEKIKYTLKKIIKTVQNDNISSYGDRLVKIYDISCEVLKELEK